MTRDQVLKLLVSILGSREREVVCSEFFERLPGYVDQVLSGSGASQGQSKPPDPAMSDIVHHIEQCAECREAYELLLEVAEMDS
jgi:hypothetical protein